MGNKYKNLSVAKKNLDRIMKENPDNFIEIEEARQKYEEELSKFHEAGL